MSKYKCIIVDDEPIAQEIMEAYVEKLPSLELVACCSNALEAIEVLHQHAIDLMFLDIHMPQLSGMDLLKTLKSPPAIILTTAYRNYAVESYEYEVLDYLVKPIPFDRFLKAVNRFFEKSGSPASTQNEEIAEITVRENKKQIRIKLVDILYLESLRDYVKIVTNKGKVVTYQTLSNFEKELPFPAFMRVHKSFIIANEKVKSVSSNSIELDGEEIPIGKTYLEKVRTVLRK